MLGYGARAQPLPCSNCGTGGALVSLTDAAREGWEYWTGITSTTHGFQYDHCGGPQPLLHRHHVRCRLSVLRWWGVVPSR